MPVADPPLPVDVTVPYIRFALTAPARARTRAVGAGPPAPTVAFHCMATRPPTRTEPVTETGMTSPTVNRPHSPLAGHSAGVSRTVKVAVPVSAWLESEMLSTTSTAVREGAPAQAAHAPRSKVIPSPGRFPIQVPLRLAAGAAVGGSVLAGGASVDVDGMSRFVPGPQAGPSEAQAKATKAKRPNDNAILIWSAAY